MGIGQDLFCRLGFVYWDLFAEAILADMFGRLIQ